MGFFNFLGESLSIGYDPISTAQSDALDVHKKRRAIPYELADMRSLASDRRNAAIDNTLTQDAKSANAKIANAYGSKAPITGPLPVGDATNLATRSLPPDLNAQPGTPPNTTAGAPAAAAPAGPDASSPLGKQPTVPGAISDGKNYISETYDTGDAIRAALANAPREKVTAVIKEKSAKAAALRKALAAGESDRLYVADPTVRRRTEKEAAQLEKEIQDILRTTSKITPERKPNAAVKPTAIAPTATQPAAGAPTNIQPQGRDASAAPVSAPALQLIRNFEGFREKAYWDVDAYRAGYGSDTVTRADGTVEKVTENTVVSREDAERDLARRAPEFAAKAASDVGSAVWQTLPQTAKDALTSVAYNYGTVPKSVVAAAKSGDPNTLAQAIAALPDNPNRRQQEASYALTGNFDTTAQALTPVQAAIKTPGKPGFNTQAYLADPRMLSQDMATIEFTMDTLMRRREALASMDSYGMETGAMMGALDEIDLQMRQLQVGHTMALFSMGMLDAEQGNVGILNQALKTMTGTNLQVTPYEGGFYAIVEPGEEGLVTRDQVMPYDALVTQLQQIIDPAYAAALRSSQAEFQQELALKDLEGRQAIDLERVKAEGRAGVAVVTAGAKMQADLELAAVELENSGWLDMGEDAEGNPVYQDPATGEMSRLVLRTTGKGSKAVSEPFLEPVLTE